MSEQHTKTTCDCGCMGAGPALTQVLRHLGPSAEVRQHFSNAHVEILKGIRAFLDEQIAAHSSNRPGESTQAGHPGSATHGTRIPVE